MARHWVGSLSMAKDDPASVFQHSCHDCRKISQTQTAISDI